jgi:hypothetical protein
MARINKQIKPTNMTHTQTDFEITRVDCDNDGNSRYVVHFLNFITKQDKAEAWLLSKTCTPFNFSTHYEYEIAIRKARKIGGKRYKAKHYGGGIIFTSNSKQALAESIAELMDETKQTFYFSFNGRLLGAIGKTHFVTTKVIAENKEKAIIELYNKYEHITNLKIK